MSAELIISIISLVLTFVVGIFTAIVTFKVGRFEHLEKIKTYEKNITNFELQFKDERWLSEILENGEFDHYNMKSKKRIQTWWDEYKKKNPPILLQSHVEYAKLRIQGISAQGIHVPTGGEDTCFISKDDELPGVEDLF